MDEIRAAIRESMAELPPPPFMLPEAAEEEECPVILDCGCEVETDCCMNCCDPDCDCF